MNSIVKVGNLFLKKNKNLEDNSINQKIKLFFLMHEIIMATKKSNQNFLKQFGNNIKEMLLSFCEFIYKKNKSMKINK